MAVAFSLKVQVVMAKLMFDNGDQFFLAELLVMFLIELNVMRLQHVAPAGGAQTRVEESGMAERLAKCAYGNLFNERLQAF